MITRKVFYAFLFLLVVVNNTPGFAQGSLWGVNFYGGPDGGGSIFKTKGDGTNLTVVKEFSIENVGTPPSEGCRLIKAANGKFYGITAYGGTSNDGVLYEYDLAQGTYKRLMDFENATRGASPFGGLLEVNGKLYGMTYAGGTSGMGVLFEYVIASGAYSVKLNFDYYYYGGYPMGGLTLGPNGKLYGLVTYGGTAGYGTLIEFDPGSGVVNKKLDFDGAFGGGYGGDMMLAANGKLYGTSTFGGPLGGGSLFEYDVWSGTYIDVYDFSGFSQAGQQEGINPVGTLVETSNGIFYGMTYQGGTKGTVFEFNANAGVRTKLVDLTGPNGAIPFFNSLTKGPNSKLYGTTYGGGSNDTGVLFELDPANGLYTKKLDFVSASTGSNPSSLLFDNQKLYGTTLGGGSDGLGLLFEYDPVTETFNRKMDFARSLGGANPKSSLVQAPDGKIYGSTWHGGIEGSGIIFEIDPISGNFKKKADLNASLGSFVNGDLLVASNGRLYGMTSSLASLGYGSLFEFNPANGAIVKKLDFDGVNGGNPQSNGMIQASNGKLYGLTSNGGLKSQGVLFEYDISTDTYTKKLDFDEATSGAYPQGNLVEGITGKLYGFLQQGGNNSAGTLIEFDISASMITKRIDLDPSTAGQFPCGSLVKAGNGKLYTMTRSGGSGGYGVIIEFDPSSGNVVTKFNFHSGATEGGQPIGRMTVGSNGKLYGATYYGGQSDKGVLFEYDLENSTYTTKVNFSAEKGFNFYYSSLLLVNSLDQTIAFDLIPTKNYGGIDFDLNAVASSGLPITFSSSDTTVAKINGKSVTILKAGSAAIKATQEGNLSYNAADTTQILIIDKGTPEISWSKPADITYGTILGLSQLNATANISGNFVYSPANGVQLDAGNNQLLKVEFIPDDVNNYDTVFSTTVNINVNKATPIITWPDPGSIAFGTALSATQLNAMANVPGTFTYSPPAGTLLDVAENQQLTVDFMPDDLINFVAVLNSHALINVGQSSQSITFNNLPAVTLGDADFSLSASSTSLLVVDFASTSTNIMLTGNQVSLIAAGHVTVTASQSGNQNYSAATPVDRSFCINPPRPVITVDNSNPESPLLSSSSSSGNQWYMNGDSIPGAMQANFTPITAGTYTVQISSDGCKSEFSEEVSMVITGDISKNSGWDIYPNPVDTYLIIRGLAYLQSVEVINLLGESGSMTWEKINEGYGVHVQHLSSGLYLLKLQTPDGWKSARFIKR